MSQQFNALTISSNIGGSGIKIRMPVMTVATTNLAIGTSFVGQTINGYTLLDGDRIALTAQTTGIQNGIYIASTTNRRAPDHEIGDQSYCSFYVINGLYAGTQWQSTANGIIDIGTHGFVMSNINIYGAGDIMYSSSTTQRQLLNKPNVTSILQMLSDGTPSWINSVPTTMGGTGLTNTTPLKVLATDSVGNYQLTNDLRINNILNTTNTMCSFADGGTQYLTIGSGTAPYLQPTGTSTNIDLDIYTKGTGTINLRQPMRIYNGTQYVGIRSPTLSSNIQLTLPTTVGTANQLLSTDGTGQLSFRTLTGTDFGSNMYYTVSTTPTSNSTLSSGIYYYILGTQANTLPTPFAGSHIMISTFGTVALNCGFIIYNLKSTSTSTLTVQNATVELIGVDNSTYIAARIINNKSNTSNVSVDGVKVSALGELNNIPNVSVGTANSGDVLVYNGTQWINQPYPTFVSTIFGRSGTVVAQEGDYSLNQLGDVTITTPSSGQSLQYNGTQWTNATPTPYYTYVISPTSGSNILPNQAIILPNGGGVYNVQCASFAAGDKFMISTYNNGNTNLTFQPTTGNQVRIVNSTNNSVLSSNTNAVIMYSAVLEMVCVLSTGGQTTFQITNASINDVLGQILIGSQKFAPIYDIGQIPNVFITSPSNGQYLQYNSGLWTNASIPTSTSFIRFTTGTTNLATNNYVGAYGISTTAIPMSFVVPRAITLTQINVLLGANQTAANGWTFTIRKNTVNTAGAVTITGVTNGGNANFSVAFAGAEYINIFATSVGTPVFTTAVITLSYV